MSVDYRVVYVYEDGVKVQVKPLSGKTLLVRPDVWGFPVAGTKFFRDAMAYQLFIMDGSSQVAIDWLVGLGAVVDVDTTSPYRQWGVSIGIKADSISSDVVAKLVAKFGLISADHLAAKVMLSEELSE